MARAGQSGAIMLCTVGPASLATGNLHDPRPVISIEQLRCDPPTIHSGMRDTSGPPAAASFRSLVRPAGALYCPSIAASAVLVLPCFAANCYG